MKRILIIGLVSFSVSVIAQDTEYAYQTFADTRIINGQSVETSDGGELKMIISHRFGDVNGGAYEWFGLDQSTIRIGFDYGINNSLTVGWGRSSFEKTYDGLVKYRALTQSKGTKNMPISLTGFAAVALNSVKWANPDRENFFSSRLNYAYQLIIARKFSDRLSIQIMPTLVHRNLVPTADIAHDVLACGLASKYQITAMLALKLEYYYTLPNQLEDGRTNSLSIGVDIETKGHVFQLHLSNSRGMIEKFFVTETFGDWTKAEIGLGFNITRDWRMTGRK